MRDYAFSSILQFLVLLIISMSQLIASLPANTNLPDLLSFVFVIFLKPYFCAVYVLPPLESRYALGTSQQTPSPFPPRNVNT